MFYALLCILIYVGIRFDYRYAPGAVLALFHDTVITVGVFILTQKQFDLQILAALLALIGYSNNDTIIVYDRVRETLHAHHAGGPAASRLAHAAWNAPIPAPNSDSQCAWPAAPAPTGRAPEAPPMSGCALPPRGTSEAPSSHASASGSGPAVYRYAPKLSPPSV